MRQFMGRFRIVTAAASLLLAAAAAVMWVRSYWTADVGGANRKAPAATSQTFWSAAGYLGLYRWHMPAGSDVRVSPVGWFYRNGPASSADRSRFLEGPGVRRFAGVAYLDYTHSRPGAPLNGMHEWGLCVPYWILVAVLGAWPAARVMSFRRRRRAARLAAGLCPQCGYDL